MTLDTPATLAALHRTNAIAKARRLALNEIDRESRNASSLQALRDAIDRINAELAINEANVSK
jgi:hypothetical protein